MCRGAQERDMRNARQASELRIPGRQTLRAGARQQATWRASGAVGCAQRSGGVVGRPLKFRAHTHTSPTSQGQRQWNAATLWANRPKRAYVTGSSAALLQRMAEARARKEGASCGLITPALLFWPTTNTAKRNSCRPSAHRIGANMRLAARSPCETSANRDETRCARFFNARGVETARCRSTHMNGWGSEDRNMSTCAIVCFLP